MSQNIVMSPIRWLHISDIHLRTSDAWSQNLVLTAMCDFIAQQYESGKTLDFILATGDLAFSGKADEYEQAASFFDALSKASGVVTDHLFCVPGNHDIDRERQRMCFHGARTILQNQNQVDLVLSGGEDLETLLKREENYRQFQTHYFKAQGRTRTADGLGYVSSILIDNVRIAIIGLDSAWLSEGGIEDRGKLLIGERQVVDALEQANMLNPHIVIGMSHHPFHLLHEFDHQIIRHRVQHVCRFFHCGHLHEPESVIGGYSDKGCLTLYAGASFETRHSYNTYSIVTLDLPHAVSTVDIVQYNPHKGSFSITDSLEYRTELPPIACTIRELAHAIKTYSKKLSPWSHYLSALLLDQKAEFPISDNNNYTFGTFDVIQGLSDSDMKQKTSEFMAFRNVLRVFYKHIPLTDILVQRGSAVEQYGDVLQKLCSVNSEISSRLVNLEEDSENLADTEPDDGFSHTIILLDDLADSKEWAFLRDRAQSHIDSPNPKVAIHARRMLALSLANSEDANDKKEAINIYRQLTNDESTDFTDTGNLAILLMDNMSDQNIEEAKVAVLDGISKFPSKADYYMEIGQMIIAATGDKDFRQQLESAVAERGKSG